MREYPSKVGKSNKRSESLRLTMPKEVGEWLGIKIGDTAIWRVNIVDADTVEVTVVKAEK